MLPCPASSRPDLAVGDLGRQRSAGKDVVDADGLVGGRNVAVLGRRAEEPVAVGVAGLLHLCDDAWPLFAAAQVAAFGMVGQVNQLLLPAGEIPQTDGVEVAHDHVRSVAIAHRPGAHRAQLRQPHFLFAVPKVGLIDGEVAPVRQANARFEQTARLLALDVRQVVGGAGDDGPATQQGVAVGAGRHIILGWPAHAGAKDRNASPVVVPKLQVQASIASLPLDNAGERPRLVRRCQALRPG